MDVSNVPGGLYLYALEIKGEPVLVKKMVVE